MTSTRDAWLSSFEEARSTCDDVFLLLAERDDALREGATSAISRLSATARRKWSALKAKLDALAADVASGGVSEREQERRRDMIQRLRSQVEQIEGRLSRRAALLGDDSRRAAGAAAGGGRPQETDETAMLDERGLLGLQHQVMHEQDTALDELSAVVTSTRHVAVAINEELTLQHHLLEDLDDAVDHTQNRMQWATARIRVIMQRSNSTKLTCIMLLVIVVLVLVLIGVIEASAAFG